MQIVNILLVVSFCSAILADNSCIFEHPTKGIINLSSIGLRNGQPRFRDLSSPSSSYYMYSFNPCYSFTENSCYNAAVCQISSDRKHSFTLGTQGVSTWTLDSDVTPVLTYTYGENTVSITMICSTVVEDEFEILGEYTVNHYSMHLRSRCACWNGCTSPQTSTSTSRTSPTTTRSIYYDACHYHDSQYGTIDLSSIGSMTGPPIFKDVESIFPNNFVWSYNPCYKFSEDSCQNVAGCQIDKTRHISYTIGLQENAYWINMNNTQNLVPAIVYPSSSSNRRLTVQLICNPSLSSHRLQVLGETSVGKYVMELTSPCACWDGCTTPIPPRVPFRWRFWMIASAVLVVVFLLFLMMITCLFCSKPKRNHPIIVFDEKTPIMKGVVNYHQ
ncbi:unnamed protein product [Rotaria sordida]|uniref:MRH domain-containing protein n=1 Tax=Rotaria sordida TaxID=392033 RepID=A0A818W509_9BILA|nr:unnamed protein product [Rotaria sordida]CAF3720723.1 unnamed protein product [Rotaria sordida]